MTGRLAALRWALDLLLAQSAKDADSPAWNGPRVGMSPAGTLSQAELDLVHEFPAGPADGAELRAAVEELLERHVVNGRSPRFQNQLFAGVEPDALAGAFLGLFTNNTLSTREVAPLPSEMETALLGWLRTMLPWDEERSGGSVTPSGSFSNYLSVFLARRRATDRLGDDAIVRLAAFTSKAGHYSIPRGADLAGIASANVFHVDADEQNRMRPEALREALEDAESRGLVPFFVNATLGTTVLGSLDPIVELRAVLGDRPVWLHADGAWGAFGLFGSERETFRTQLEAADSLTWDAHKGLGAPTALSFLMVREHDSLDALMPTGGSEYLFRHRDAPPESADLGLRSLYCGKPFNSLALWLLWKSHGESGLREHVDRARAAALRFHRLIAESAHYEPIHQPETWAVAFRARGANSEERAALGTAAHERINADGRWMIRLCPRDGEFLFRAIFVNPLITEAHADELAAHVEACHPAVAAGS